MSDDDEEQDSMEMINNQFAQMTCEGGEQDLCDDSDSLDEALDAECLDDENTFIASNLSSTNIQ